MQFKFLRAVAVVVKKKRTLVMFPCLLVCYPWPLLGDAAHFLDIAN